ncbi:MAG: glycoside hydrolase family 3 C-terminal domain-containing protein, partial [Bacteroidota bacterium]|nr:glycoside hydrolase family 3 C-terminal domain-containing protein [Bacteroidota bacterium]
TFANAQKVISADDAKVDALIKKMTLEEKIGQMTQVTLAVIAKGGWANTDGTLDAEKLKEAIQKYKVGSMLNTTAHALNVETWHQVIKEIQDEALNTKLKIPVLYGLDAIHGQTYTLNSTLFPHNLAMAATRNPELVKAAAKVCAKELRASGVRWNFAPVLDLGRQPLWSRFPETYGEDVYIGKTLGVAAIQGYEEDGLKNPTAVASCMKHYLGYSASRTGKDRTPIYMPEIEMREYYLPQFRDAVKAGSSSIMINSSDINGTPVHASKYLLTDVLRKELGFQGLIVTDWEDIIRLHTIHKVAATPREAVVMAINAGIDMSMVPGDYSFFDLLKEAVEKKEVSIDRINDAVKRILKLKFKLGLFDNAYTEEDAKANFGRPEYQTIALSAAHEAITLVKNKNNILPLSKNKKVLVMGPTSQSIAPLNGSWSYTWQGNQEEWYPKESKTIEQAIADKVGADNVIAIGAKGFDAKENYDIDKLKANADKADIIVLCLGENAYAESPGNIRDLALPEEQVKLAEAAFATGKKVVLLLIEGRPRFITNIEPGFDAIVLPFWSGRKTAEATADVLFGDYNPNGILPFSYPKSMGEMVMYDYKNTESKREVFNDDVLWNGYDPLFAFGFGLSYTTFTCNNLHLSTDTLKGNQKLTVSISVSNTGKVDGKHTVELYSRDLYASISPNNKRLRAFKKIELKAGETKAVNFIIDKNDLAFVNAQLKTVTEPGDFEILIGNQKAGFFWKE